MKIDSIAQMPTLEVLSKKNETFKTGDTVFEALLDGAKKLLNETNQADFVAQQKTEAFILGKTDNLHEMQIAQEKAGILMQLTVQTRNNAIEAYKEIMRLPV